MSREILVQQIKNVIVPKIMEEFKTLHIPDIKMNHLLYSLEITEIVTNVVPLQKDQIGVAMLGAKNALNIKVENFHMKLNGKSYAWAGLLWAHGSAIIDVKVEDLNFTLQPRLKKDGPYNTLDYHVGDLMIYIRPGDIKIERITFGLFPPFIVKLFTQTIVDIILATFGILGGLYEAIIQIILNVVRIGFPNHFEVPYTPFSVSLSLPQTPILSEEKAVLSFDGTVYLTSEGYNPWENTITPIPNYNSQNPNNVQIYYHEYVLNTFVESLGKSEITVPIVKAFVEALGLEEAFSYLPFAANLTAFDYGIYSGLKSEFKFKTDELYG